MPIRSDARDRPGAGLFRVAWVRIRRGGEPRRCADGHSRRARHPPGESWTIQQRATGLRRPSPACDQNAESLPLSPADLVSKWDEAQGNRPASQQQQPGNSSTSSVKDLAALARSRGASFLVQVRLPGASNDPSTRVDPALLLTGPAMPRPVPGATVASDARPCPGGVRRRPGRGPVRRPWLGDAPRVVPGHPGRAVHVPVDHAGHLGPPARRHDDWHLAGAVGGTSRWATPPSPSPAPSLTRRHHHRRARVRRREAHLLAGDRVGAEHARLLRCTLAAAVERAPCP